MKITDIEHSTPATPMSPLKMPKNHHMSFQVGEKGYSGGGVKEPTTPALLKKQTTVVEVKSPVKVVRDSMSSPRKLKRSETLVSPRKNRR